MRNLLLGISLCWLLAVTADGYAKQVQPYLKENREQYIASVLRAFESTSMTEISNTLRYLSVAERNYCRSSLSDLRADCLLSYAEKNCKSSGDANAAHQCELYSDVIVVNKLNEKVFLSHSERYKILKNKDEDFRKTMANRLQQKYARIVSHFSLTDAADCDANDFDCLAQGLDQFCLDYANTQSLSWQHCVGAALWIIGTAKSQ